MSSKNRLEKRKEHIIYTYTSRSSFVQTDIAFLKNSYTITEYRFSTSNKLLMPYELLKQFFFLLFNIHKTSILISMFGGYHSLLPALFGKWVGRISIVITGGTDCVSFPSIGYGNFNNKLLGSFTRWSLKYSTHIVPVHESLIIADYTYQNKDFPKQGFKYHCPDVKTPCTVINYGFDPDKWYVPGTEKKANSFITVAAGLDKPYRAALKGVDLILEAAAELPGASFTIIGCPDWYKLPVKSDNVTVHSFISNEKLRDLYNRHEFYVQVSISEGFPNAICEAMTCKCIPIGSNVGGIPDIIDKTGFILQQRDSEEFKTLLSKAMKVDKRVYGDRARAHILEKYPKELREKELTKLLNELINKHQR